MTELDELVGASKWFPKFKVKTVTMGLTIVQVIMFLVSLTVGMSDWSPSTCSLYFLGGAFHPAVIRNLEIHRLFLPVFLHANFAHILVLSTQVNILFQLQFGFVLEQFYGRIRFLVIYFTSAVIGNLFAGFFDNYVVIVGASTSLFGLLGSQCAVFASTWKREDPRRLERLSIYAVTVFITFVLTSLWPHSTTAGHFWGFVSGVCFGFIVLPFTHKHWIWWLLRTAALSTWCVGMWWVVRQSLRNQDFFDCSFPMYETKNGDWRGAGDDCLQMCADYSPF